MIRRTITLFVCLLLFVSYAKGEYYYNPYIDEGNTPGSLNQERVFPFGAGGPSGWNILDELTQEPDPVWSDYINLPFTFNFNGTDFDALRASNSGIVTFSQDTIDPPDFGNFALPYSEVPDSSICILGLTPNWAAGDDYARVATKTFGSAPNRQFWIKYNTYSTTNTSENGFVVFAIVLEEGTDEIFVVDQRGGNVSGMGVSIGVQINGNTATSVAGSPNIPSRSSSSGEYGDNTFYNFIQGERPAHDVNIRELTIPPYVSIEDGGSKISGIIRNFGAEDLNSLVATYTINGADAVTETITLNDLATHGETEIEHSVQWEPTETGTYEIELELTEPNGGTDARPQDNTDAVDVRVEHALTERRTLVETFTSATCPPCKPGNENLEGGFDNLSDEYVSLRYQVNWPGVGDPYYTKEIERRWQGVYNEVSGVPSTVLDGGEPFTPSGTGPQEIVNRILEAREIPAIIDISGYAYLSGNQEVTYNYEIEALSDIEDELIFHVAIAEKRTEKNEMNNGEEEFFNVMKKMMPNEEGTAISGMNRNEVIKVDSFHKFRGDYRLPEDASHENIINHNIEHSVEDFENLEVITFVQSANTREVYQAHRTDVVLEDPSTLANETGSDNHMNLYPNPASDELNIMTNFSGTANVVITNVQGKTVFESTEYFTGGDNAVAINTSAIEPGMYILKVTDDMQSLNSRLIIR